MKRYEDAIFLALAGLVTIFLVWWATTPDPPERYPGPLKVHVDWRGPWPTTTTTTTTTTTVAAEPPPDPPARLAAPPEHDESPPIAQPDKLARIRECESDGNYAYNDGTYTGAYNFDAETHRGVGGDGDASDDTPAEQDAAAQRLIAKRGYQPWPVCGKR